MMRVRFGDCVLDSDTRQLFVRDAEVHLQPKAFQFLELLLENRPRVVAKDEIHQKLWPGTFVSDGTLTSLLAEVRSAIGDDAHEGRFVRTVHRVGYAFSAAAQEIRERPAPLAKAATAAWLLRGQTRIPLEAGESILGRDPGASVHLDDPSVSRRHARILVAGDDVTVEDLGSKNGTFLDEARVDRPVAMADGARLRVGSIELTVRIFPVPDSTQSAVKSES
jgi:DNA-binding winged helix-turn-helix (wHTH) protein